MSDEWDRDWAALLEGLPQLVRPKPAAAPAPAEDGAALDGAAGVWHAA
jgi:hypothetical protein